jgi:hypothetical protein
VLGYCRERSGADIAISRIEKPLSVILLPFTQGLVVTYASVKVHVAQRRRSAIGSPLYLMRKLALVLDSPRNGSPAEADVKGTVEALEEEATVGNPEYHVDDRNF